MSTNISVLPARRGKPPAKNDGEQKRLDVSRIMREMTKPFEDAEKSLDFCSKARSTRDAIWGRSWPARNELANCHDRERATQKRAAIEELDRRLPSIEELDPWYESITEAICVPAREAEIRLLVGMLLDGFRTRATDGVAIAIEAYLYAVTEGFEHASGEFLIISRAVLAAAVREAWRNRVFAPTISELLGDCKKHYAKLGTAKYYAGDFVKARSEIRYIVDNIDSLVPKFFTTFAPAPFPLNAPLGPTDRHPSDGELSKVLERIERTLVAGGNGAGRTPDDA